MRNSGLNCRWRVTALSVAVASLVWVSGALAQTTPATRSVYDRYTEPIQFYKTGLGNFKKPISTKNAEAQAYFDQFASHGGPPESMSMFPPSLDCLSSISGDSLLTVIDS